MRKLTVFVPLALALWAGRAQAQPDTAKAEAMFKEGKRLMTEGKIAEACVAFQGSYKKDPAVSTLLNLADCREKNKQYASAWGAFVEAERATRNTGDAAQQAINTLAKDRASKLEPRISFLTISVPDESRVEGLTITNDGEPVDSTEWNRALPADIGKHQVSATAPAYESWSTTVTIVNEQEKQSVTIPKFKPLPKPRLGPSVDIVDPSPITGKRKLAIGLAGVGVAGIGVGVAMYFSGKSTYDEAKVEPDDTKQRQLTDDANQKYLIAQIAGGVGVAALGAATYLWITGKPATIERRPVTFAPQLGPDSFGLAAAGSF